MTIYWIRTDFSGRIGIASRPRGGAWIEDDIETWKTDGVDLVVSLLTTDEIEEFDLGAEELICREHEIGFRSFSIPDRGVPASRDEALDLVAELAQVVTEGKNVVVHCRQGIGRSGLVVAAVLAQLGEEPDRALALVEEARGRPVPDTEEQREWVRGLPVCVEELQ